jgi:hypothetical protein
MIDNNPQAAGVNVAANVTVAPGVNNELPHEIPFTAGEAASVLAQAGVGSNGNGATAAAATAPPLAAPPAAVDTRLVSGRYGGPNEGAGTPDEMSLELRVDVEGKSATGRVSGDFFQKSGGVLRHWGSFVIASPRVMAGDDEVTIGGRARFGTNKKAPNVLVTIRRAPRPALRATVIFSDAEGNVEDTFGCKFASPFFRTVEYEVDIVAGTEVFDVYNVKSPGAATRPLTVDLAYADAGIEMLRTGVSNVIVENTAAPPTGTDGKWSDAELHSSMLTNFSLLDHAAQGDLTREGQWKLWLLVATEHEQKGMRGMMFDSHWGRQRQGCAVFYKEIAGGESEAKRAALRTYVHEIGHCLNLVHPWDKAMSSLPPSQSDSLSFMNYVDMYPGGEKAYWEKFAFEFDKHELVHLRHAFRDDIIMGGNFFGTGAAELGARALNRPLNDAGLSLKLESRKSFMLCEPVVVELKLYRKGVRYKRVHRSIHPDRGFVHLAIRKPDGRVVSYRPMAARCLKPDFTVLRKKQPSIYASAYIGYGMDGFYFDQAGFYQLVAVYQSPCGSEVVSEPLTLRVRNPLNEAEEEIADLYYGNDQGALFYLLGSDSKHLSSGNRSLDNVLDKYGQHPLAIHAHLVKGVNSGRHFKTVTERKRLAARPPRAEDSERRLAHIVDSAIGGAAGGPRFDNITLNMCARRLARAKKRRGDEGGAEATLKAVFDYFKRAGLKKHVLRLVEEQAKRTLEEKY